MKYIIINLVPLFLISLILFGCYKRVEEKPLFTLTGKSQLEHDETLSLPHRNSSWMVLFEINHPDNLDVDKPILKVEVRNLGIQRIRSAEMETHKYIYIKPKEVVALYEKDLDDFSGIRGTISMIDESSKKEKIEIELIVSLSAPLPKGMEIAFSVVSTDGL